VSKETKKETKKDLFLFIFSVGGGEKKKEESLLKF
jgi:hypothetical protein